MHAPTPPNEEARLQALRSYSVLDTPPEAGFDEIAQLAAQICGLPVALVSFVDAERQWFKARIGFDRDETPRDVSFCAHALQSQDLLEVGDAAADARFAANSLVTADGIRFYAGAPLVDPSGNILGTLCVMDRTPRQLAPAQAQALRILARQVVARLQLRRHLLEQVKTEAELRATLQERTRTETALRRSERLARLAGRLGRHGAWSVELPDGHPEWSEEIFALFDLPARSPAPAAAPDVLPPGWRTRLAPAIRQCAQDGEPFDFELEIVTAAGRGSWLRVVGELERDASGRGLRVQGALQDISDRKDAARRTRELAERLTATVESITDGFFTLSHDWHITYLNREAERMFKVSRHRLLEEPFWDSFPDLRNTLAEKEFLRAARDQLPAQFEMFHAPLGAWFDVRAFPSIQGLAVYFRDVSAQRLAQTALQASEQRYRLLFAGNPMPMWVFELQSLRFLAVNAAAVEHYGYSEAEFLALDLRALRPPEDVPKLEENLRAFKGVGKEFRRFRHRKKSGEIIEVEIVSDAIDLDGRAARLVLINDITTRVAAEREAARANRALQMLSRSNEALIRADREADLLAEICRTAVEVGAFRMAWVGYALDDAERTIAPQAHAGHEGGYLGDIRLTWSDTGRQGPAARAIRGGAPVVLADFSAADSGFDYWLEPALARGYRGIVCLPLCHQGRNFGVLCLYLGEVRDVPGDELRLLQELASNLAFGLVNLRARHDRQRTHDAVLAMARGVSASTGAEFLERLTSSMVEALGAQSGFLVRVGRQGQPDPAAGWAVLGSRSVPAFDCGLLRHALAAFDGDGLWTVARDASRRPELADGLPVPGVEAFVGTRLADNAGRPLGVMFVLFNQPLEDADFIGSTLKIFGARAAAELEREHAEARTREQAALIDEARDAIIVRDLDHRVTFWSKGAERLYGWPAEAAVGLNFDALLQVDPARSAAAAAALRADGVWSGELQTVARSGRGLTVDSRWTLLRTDGAPRSILTLDTDITESKRLEQQFLRAQRMESIGTLAGGIAHDLNNLLLPIVMGVDLLKQFDPAPESLEIIANIERSARRGTNLVKQVLSFARGVEGARVAIDLRHTVREIEAIVQNTFPKNIVFAAELPAEVWLTTGDPTQLNQVLLNLCVNARDAMPAGGRLGVAVRPAVLAGGDGTLPPDSPPGRHLCLEVSDTGVGMARETIDRIFEPFFTTKELGKGTGLGLSTVLGIVRSHGGFVHVDSAPGRGSTFRVYLRARAETEAGPAAPFAAADALPRGRGERVLVVDDEAPVRHITEQTLHAFGYRTRVAADGREALALVRAEPGGFALVVTDMMMPGMDGPTLIAELRRRLPAVPIIAVSGLTTAENAARATSAGVNHFLPKPDSAEALLQLVHRALRG